MTSIRRGAVLAAGVLVLSLLGPAAGTGAAQASGPAGANTLVLVNCTGSARQDFTPGLQPYPQEVTVWQEGTLSTCLPNAHNIANGRFTIAGEGRLDCLIGGSTEGLLTVEWVRSDGTVMHSVAEYPIISFTVRSTGQTIAVVTAKIISGLFAGHLVVNEGVLLQSDVLRCLLFRGVETVSGPQNFTII